jgi:hypothetical protein
LIPVACFGAPPPPPPPPPPGTISGVLTDNVGHPLLADSAGVIVYDTNPNQCAGGDIVTLSSGGRFTANAVLAPNI